MHRNGTTIPLELLDLQSINNSLSPPLLQMFRTTSRRFLVAGAAVLTPMMVAHADRAPLDTRMKKMHVVPHTVARQQTVPLELVATGMRRKSFYVMAVDVYMTGLSVTPTLSRRLKQSKPDEAIEVILSSPAENPYPHCSTCITMNFVRDVTTAQCVDAFKDAFKGCDAAGIEKFGAVMTEAVGANGCKVGEEVTFYWLDGGGLCIDRAGTKQYGIRDEEIERRLLEVYLHPSRTVAPDLLKSFAEFLNEK